jgi:fucose permease
MLKQQEITDKKASMDKNRNFKVGKLLPILLAYVVMGFVDIVGVSAGFIKKDFNLTDDVAQLIPAMAFLWFFLLSVPVSIFQSRFGKKNTLNIGMLVTGLAMIIPFLHYSFPVMLMAFLLLGIGNTIVQVPLNPLLHDVVPKELYSSYMSLTQFIKAITSLLGPVMAAWAAIQFGNWRIVFAVYAITSFLAIIWLYFTPVEESKVNQGQTTFTSALSLLKDPFVLLLVIAIFLSVGAEVGLNSNIANYIMNIFNIPLEKASYVISYYYTALMIGRFMGALLLNWLKPRIFLSLSAAFAVISLLLFVNAPSLIIAKVAIFLTGLGSANLFPIMFAININKNPERSNELSGLMIMSVVGGAVVPPLMGIVNVHAGLMACMYIPVICLIYILGVSIHIISKGYRYDK